MAGYLYDAFFYQLLSYLRKADALRDVAYPSLHLV